MRRNTTPGLTGQSLRRLRAVALGLRSPAVPGFGRGPGFLEMLEPRVHLSVTPVIAHTNDQAVKSDGTFVWIGQANHRVGDNGTNTAEQAAVYPFLLPSIPANQYLANASLTVNLESIGNASSVVGPCDLYAINSPRTASTVLASDYYEGAYGGDGNATAIQQTLMDKNTPPGLVTTSTGAQAALTTFLTNAYSGGATGKYVFLRLNAESDQLTSRFWVVSSANTTNSAWLPTLNLTFLDATPNPPTNLAATTVSSSQINLTWTAPGGTVLGYYVYRGTSAGGEGPTPIGSTTLTSYSDTTVSPGTQYYYTVKAYNNAGTSSASNETSAWTRTQAPTNVTVTINGATTSILNWTAPSGTVTSYTIQRGTDGIYFSTVGSSATPTFNDSGLTANTTYYYQVAAINGGGTSAYSATASNTTIPTLSVWFQGLS